MEFVLFSFRWFFYTDLFWNFFFLIFLLMLFDWDFLYRHPKFCGKRFLSVLNVLENGQFTDSLINYSMLKFLYYILLLGFHINIRGFRFTIVELFVNINQFLCSVENDANKECSVYPLEIIVIFQFSNPKCCSILVFTLKSRLNFIIQYQNHRLFE